MQTILIIEDDTNINNLIAEALRKAGLNSKQAFSGTEGILYLENQKNQPLDLVILDLMLPGLSGNEVLAQIRQKYNIPVIIVSAIDGLNQRLQLLRDGADDYLTKPFELSELIVRVEVLLRRANPQDFVNSKLKYKELVLIPENHKLQINDNDIALTKIEFKILELLMSQPKRIFSKEDIYAYAWDDIFLGEEKTVNVHISNIRKKIKQHTKTEYIETVWGIGFKIAD
ncbi:MAG: response regulator transcription factor [Clostridiaceae bacterium]|nr:response regulator transcription factor [Clostridiaceae bacterium]